MENCLQLREKTKKIRRETAVFGGSDGSAAVSSQFYIVLHKSNFQNFRAVTLSWAEIMLVLLFVSKSGTSASPPPPFKPEGKFFFLANKIEFGELQGRPIFLLSLVSTAIHRIAIQSMHCKAKDTIFYVLFSYYIKQFQGLVIFHP